MCIETWNIANIFKSGTCIKMASSTHFTSEKCFVSASFSYLKKIWHAGATFHILRPVSWLAASLISILKSISMRIWKGIKWGETLPPCGQKNIVHHEEILYKTRIRTRFYFYMSIANIFHTLQGKNVICSKISSHWKGGDFDSRVITCVHSYSLTFTHKCPLVHLPSCT